MINNMIFLIKKSC